jgi:peptidoglycan/xylan/chitin deacetylase (PgdA/CDA1 family)
VTIAAVAAALLILFIALTAFSISYYEYHGLGNQEGIVRKGSQAPPKAVAITFDDGPSPEYTPILLDILKQEQVSATFFMTGAVVEQYPEIVERAVREGHEVGNHTYSHVNMNFLRGAKLIREITRGERAVEKAAGSRPTLFRPPRSLLNEEGRAELVKRGYKIIMWSVSAADWGPFGTSMIVWRVRRFVHPGAIILFHDGGALVRNSGGKRHKTVNALPVIIKDLKESGYELLTISQLLQKK